MTETIGQVPYWMKKIKMDEIRLLHLMANTVNDTALEITMINGTQWHENNLCYEKKIAEKINEIK